MSRRTFKDTFRHLPEDELSNIIKFDNVDRLFSSRAISWEQEGLLTVTDIVLGQFFGRTVEVILTDTGRAVLDFSEL